MATTSVGDIIAYMQDEVAAAQFESRAFIDELHQAIGWQSEWFTGDIDTTNIPVSNGHIGIGASTLARPTVPNNLAYGETAYTSDLLNQARALLLSDLANGGYGLDPRDEQALWERSKDREQQNVNAAILETTRAIASRGFPMPSGALLAGVMKVQQAARGSLSSINRDISLKRADLYVQARQFALQTGLNAEQFMANYYGGFAERQLNALRYSLEKIGVDVRIWEAERDDRLKDAMFYLDRWAKSAAAYIDVAKIKLAERQAIADNEHKISIEGISAAREGIDMYKAIAVAAAQSQSAIATLSE